MKRIQIFILLALLALCKITSAQNNRGTVELSWEEIKNPTQLKSLLKKSTKGEKISRLEVDFDLKEKDFSTLTQIIQLSEPNELVVHLKDQPTDELLKQIKDLHILEISFHDPSMATQLSKINWENIEYVSLTANNLDECKSIPFSSITSKYIEIYKTDGEDMILLELAKEKVQRKVLISKNLLDLDSVQILNLLLPGGNITYKEDVDWKAEAPVNEQAIRNENKIEFLQNQLVPMDNWTINTSQPFYLKTRGGSILYVPAQAFVTPNGKTYKGYVDLTFQEWNSRADMINSNLPMYDTKDNGDTVFYITNGMFDIRAYDENNEPLALAENTSIGVKFPVNQPNEGFNVYAFNESTNQWDDQGEVKKNTTEVFNNISTKTINTDSLKKSTLDSMLRNLVYNFDTTKFKMRYDDLEYTNLVDFKKPKGRIAPNYAGLTPVYRHGKHTKKSIDRNRNHIRPVLKKIKINDTTSYYSISFNDRFYTRFPEIKRVFGGKMFVPAEVTRKAWKADFYTFKKYNDFKFVYNGGPYISLQLKHANGYHEVNISPRSPVIKTKRSGKISKNLVNKYNKYYKRRENIFNVQLAEKMSRFIVQQKNRIEQLQLAVQRNDTNIRKPRTIPIIYANLNILTLGLTNIDHPNYEMPQKTLVNPNYIANNQKINQIAHVQIIDQATFGIFQFKGRGFIYSKLNIQQLIVTDKTGIQYIATDESIKKLKNPGISLAAIELIPLNDNMDKIIGLGFDKLNE